jgi:hypothetical protein
MGSSGSIADRIQHLGIERAHDGGTSTGSSMEVRDIQLAIRRSVDGPPNTYPCGLLGPFPQSHPSALGVTESG